MQRPRYQVFIASIAILGLSLAQDQTCYDHIVDLAEYDSILSSRTDSKESAAEDSFWKFMYNRKMKKSKEDGEEYACGLTRSWVTEVFQGLGATFNEYKGNEREKDGYQEYYGDEVVALFEEYAESDGMHTFQLKHLGTQDHDWVVEQLPNNEGYRIYQSYNQAFSLKSWLSQSADDFPDLYAAGDMMIFEDVQEQVDLGLKFLIDPSLSLDTVVVGDLPSEYQWLMPYLEYVRDYDYDDVVQYFTIAWEQYGKGRVIPVEEFFAADGYVESLGELVDYFKTNDGTSNEFPQEIWDLWIALAGSPDPLYFPELANNSIAQMVLGDQEYSFWIKVFDYGTNEDKINRNCGKNRDILEEAATA